MYNSPWTLLGLVVVTIFCTETLVMLLFLFLPKLPPLVETFVDSTVLSTLVLPILYFFLYRPLNKQIKERLEIEKELRLSEARLAYKAKELEKTMDKLQQAPQMLLAAKMSGLGKIVAGVAHEINNPVGFIHSNIEYVTEYTRSLLKVVDIYQQEYPHPREEIKAIVEDSEVEFLRQDLPLVLSSMKTGTERIRDIVLALRNFSRMDEAKIKRVNIHEGIDNTLLLLQYSLKLGSETSGIEVIKEYSYLPEVECYPSLLNQVFMNIFNNAIESLEKCYSNQNTPADTNYQRSIIIRTQALSNKILQISIKDNGVGISEDIKQQIFVPFFTTKSVGLGIGLGLSVSYQIIVNQHRGNIQCISQAGKGAEFIIEIPFQQ